MIKGHILVHADVFFLAPRLQADLVLVEIGNIGYATMLNSKAECAFSGSSSCTFVPR